jgi:hypothetical protein
MEDGMTDIQSTGRPKQKADPRDRLIIALYAQLKAERETREALEWVIHNGALSSEVLEAIAGDPVPAVSSDELAAVEKIVALDNRRRRH